MSQQARGRIVMFTRDLRIDRRILLEADALGADGWAVRIVAVPGDPAAGPDDPRVVRLASVPGTRSPGDSPLLRAYRALARLTPINSPAFMAARALALSFYRGGPEAFVLRLFADAIERESADVYVAHDLPMLPVAIAAAERHGGQVVYDSHELFVEQELSAVERRLWRRLEGRLIGRADLAVTINPSIARELMTRYGLARVEVIQNAERLGAGVAKTQAIRARLRLPASARILLYQGGLSEGRNLEMPIRALRHVRTPGLHLVYLGDGVLAGRLVRLAARLGLSERVHPIPAVPQSELLRYTASADAGLIPYLANCLNTRYCTPNKLFEMVAAGIPIVASDLPELRRLVAGHGIGLVGDTATPEGLAASIDALFAGEGPARFAPAIAAARRELSWEVESERLVRLYNSLISSPA
jgi:glycosyltransferase involved in cell wall biosynthesis